MAAGARLSPLVLQGDRGRPGTLAGSRPAGVARRSGGARIRIIRRSNSGEFWIGRGRTMRDSVRGRTVSRVEHQIRRFRVKNPVGALVISGALLLAAGTADAQTIGYAQAIDQIAKGCKADIAKSCRQA